MLEEVLNDLRARVRAGGPPRKRGLYATQTKTKTKGWKPPKVEVCTWEKCPQIRDSVHLARDTAIFRFLPTGHIWGPNEPILSPTDTV